MRKPHEFDLIFLFRKEVNSVGCKVHDHHHLKTIHFADEIGADDKPASDLLFFIFIFNSSSSTIVARDEECSCK